MPISERRTARLKRLAQQRLRLVELALALQQRPEIVYGFEPIKPAEEPW